ncbi:WD repeat-containing protein 75-like isoform X2 [Varroa jacobsoni]|uniref:WD repeat-containing protein 75-like isoform X2 n=1 Tax=Varroa jacobsoni TaxID=62625 RepID=UPI000BF97F16|nr:WD repeat-containing protein 75-like isoform X2 [Varroa jacobsoni]
MKIQDKELTSPEDVVCTGRCGVALCDRRGLISHDANTLYVPSGSCIRVFSLGSGEPIRTLDFHEAFVIALCPSPLNRVHVLSCSVDGVVARWDSTDYALISKDRIVEDNRKVQVFLANQESPWCVYVTHEKIDNRPKNALWLRSLTLEEPLRQLSSTCSSNINLFGIAASSDLVTWIDNDHQLRVVRCSSPATIVLIRRGRGRPVCVAVHPTDELVAVGDQDGAIFIHAGPFFQPSAPNKDRKKQLGGAPAMKLHWHSMPVADIHMSGNFLYSVGAEGVLVRWDLESDERQFLPRLGMPIRQLAVAQNEKYVVCGHSDNTITVIQAPNTVHRVIQGLVQRNFTGGGNVAGIDPFDSLMIFEACKRQLVLSGRPGQLQFYSLEHNRQACVLDVTGENLATDFKLQYELKKGINSEVLLADFAPDGRYLATIEYKTALSTTCKLKFWHWNNERGELEANTTVLMPHLRQRPRSLRMGLREGCYFCVSSGERSFKLWTIVRGDSEDQLFWQCVDERSYRQMACRALAISEDHSILAASFGHMVTLWHINLATGRGQKPDSLDNEGRGDCNTILLSVSGRSVTAWDLLSLDRLWSAQVAVKQILPDPNSSHMAALITKTSRIPSLLVVFRPDKIIEAPIAQVPLEQDDQIRCAVWVPLSHEKDNVQKGRMGCPQDVSWQTKSTLLAMGRRDKLFHFVRKENVRQNSGDNSNLALPQSVDTLLTPFGAHLSSSLALKGTREGQTFSGPAVKRDSIDLGRASQHAVDHLLQIPTHVMPSASVLAESFIKAIWLDEDDHLERRSKNNLFSNRMDNTDNIVNSDDDSDSSGAGKSKKTRIANTHSAAESDLGVSEMHKCELRAEKIRLPKIKDYRWIQWLIRLKPGDESNSVKNGLQN